MGEMFFCHPFFFYCYFLVSVPHSSACIILAVAVDAFFCLHSSCVFLLPSLQYLVCVYRRSMEIQSHLKSDKNKKGILRSIGQKKKPGI